MPHRNFDGVIRSSFRRR